MSTPCFHGQVICALLILEVFGTAWGRDVCLSFGQPDSFCGHVSFTRARAVLVTGLVELDGTLTAGYCDARASTGCDVFGLG
jgi:hypothetical protein